VVIMARKVVEKWKKKVFGEENSLLNPFSRQIRNTVMTLKRRASVEIEEERKKNFNAVLVQEK